MYLCGWKSAEVGRGIVGEGIIGGDRSRKEGVGRGRRDRMG